MGKTDRSGKENLRPRPCNYSDIANLKASELKSLCLTNGIDNKFPKKAKIIFLCHALGISTTGNSRITTSGTQNSFLKDVTPKFMCQIKNWTKDLSNVPVIEEVYVKNYLLKTDVIDVKNARSYKLTRPFELKKFIHSVVFTENEPDCTFCILRGMCNSSQSTCADEVKVVFAIIDKLSGEPLGGFCTCTVGCTETCGHIGALLFAASEFLATGKTLAPTCTDILCEWTNPKGSKASPAVASEILAKKPSTQRRTTNDYGKRVAQPDLPDYEAVLNLRAGLLAATQHLRQYVPAVHVLNPRRFTSDETLKNPPIPVPITDLPDSVSFSDSILAHSYEETIETSQMSILSLPKRTFKNDSGIGFEEEATAFYEKCTKMDIDTRKIDTLTFGQASNNEWYDQRRGAITATKFHDVIKVWDGSKKKYESLVKSIMEKKSTDDLKNVPAIKWGRTKEKKAKSEYLTKFTKFHKDLIIEEHGLVVYEKCHFIRGSPDGIVNCACHGRRLLEIKCPYSVRNLTVAEAVKSGKLKYLKLDKGRYHLLTTDTYYSQVQGLMGICGLSLCNLIVWTEKEIVTVPVHFDKNYFEEKIVPSCKDFFRRTVIPRLLIEQETDIVPQNENVEISISPSPANPISPKQHTPKLVIPKRGVCIQQSLDTEDVYKCKQCQKILPEEDILPDNSNASVGCDCPNCSGCDIWFCWPCAKYDEEWASQGDNWYCPSCIRNCDIVY